MASIASPHHTAGGDGAGGVRQEAEAAPRWTLLYYAYTPLDAPTRSGVAEWLTENAKELAIVGRVRCAFDGINATLGGSRAALDAHVDAMRAHTRFGPLGIDFKFAPSHGARSADAIAGCGFGAFSAKLCNEVVTMLRPGTADAANAGVHLSPEAFHASLLGAAAAAAGRDGSHGLFSSVCPGPADVLIDARNAYETDIGTFAPPAGVALYLPPTRTFSELPAWIEANAPAFRGKRVLMCCTGGVRCERASAFLKEACGPETEVYQLSGGIQRYMEAGEAGRLGAVPDQDGAFSGRFNSSGGSSSDSPAGASITADTVSSTKIPAANADDCGGTPTPNGTLFRGRMFVFDERPAVAVAGVDAFPTAPPPSSVIGRCCLCARPHDTYAWLRCTGCRVLVIVCDACVDARGGAEGVAPLLQCTLATCPGNGTGGGASSKSPRAPQVRRTPRPASYWLDGRKTERQQMGARVEGGAAEDSATAVGGESSEGDDGVTREEDVHAAGRRAGGDAVAV